MFCERVCLRRPFVKPEISAAESPHEETTGAIVILVMVGLMPEYTGTTIIQLVTAQRNIYLRNVVPEW